jgi:RimJ/RimL family protein N-acetyltransferase
MNAAQYSATERLRDGRGFEIRAFAPGERAALEAAIARTSDDSLYRRFFTVKRRFSEKERDFFLNVDFARHVALLAWAEESGQKTVIGGGRYIVFEPGVAEVAFIVIDAYQGQGVGSGLMRHLTAIARGGGLRELTAEVLPQNAPMLKVFQRSGLAVGTSREGGVVHVTMRL